MDWRLIQGDLQLCDTWDSLQAQCDLALGKQSEDGYTLIPKFIFGRSTVLYPGGTSLNKIIVTVLWVQKYKTQCMYIFFSTRNTFKLEFPMNIGPGGI